MSKIKSEKLFMPGLYVKPPVPRIYEKPRPLTEVEEAAVAENREMVRMYMPELAPMLKELKDFGMVDGWRSVGEVVLLDADKTEGSKHGND
jgi:hypothetical protein